MKQRLVAGHELDLLTPGEMRDIARDVLKAWKVELTRGAVLRTHSITGTTTAGGDLLAGDVVDGPNESMAWAITRLSVAPGPTLAAAGLQVYKNGGPGEGALLIRNLATDLFPGDHGVFLKSGDSLRIAGAGITANAQVVVTMSIREVPTQESWSL